MEYIENRTFEEITVGETATLTRVLTKDDILLFAAVSGDGLQLAFLARRVVVGKGLTESDLVNGK